MAIKRPIYKGNTLKSIYCKRTGISYKEFDKTLKEHGHLNEDGSIGNAKPRIVKPYIGSNQKGTYQYVERYLDELFARLQSLNEN